MKRLLLTLLSVAAVLVGCSSFNNSFNTYRGLMPPPQDGTVANKAATTVVVVPPETVVSTPQDVREAQPMPVPGEKKCGVSTFVVIPKTPDLPYDDIKKAGNDVQAIERIERKHIDELRLFILKFRHVYNTNQLDFVTKCKALAK